MVPGFYLIKEGFIEAVDLGEGRYSATIGDDEVIFENGFGFYALDGMAKVTTGEEISGSFVKSDLTYNYSGYSASLVNEGQTINFYIYHDDVDDAKFGFTVWIFAQSFDESGVPVKPFEGLIVCLDMYPAGEGSKNIMLATPDVWTISEGNGSIFKAIVNNDGTYTEDVNLGKTFPGSGMFITYYPKKGDTQAPEVYDVILGETANFKEPGSSYVYTGRTYTCVNGEIPNGYCSIEDNERFGWCFTGSTENAVMTKFYVEKVVVMHAVESGETYVFSTYNPSDYGVAYIRDNKTVVYGSDDVLSLTNSGGTSVLYIEPIKNNEFVLSLEKYYKIKSLALNGGGDMPYAYIEFDLADVDSWWEDNDDTPAEFDPYSWGVETSTAPSNKVRIMGPWQPSNNKLHIKFKKKNVTGKDVFGFQQKE